MRVASLGLRFGLLRYCGKVFWGWLELWGFSRLLFRIKRRDHAIHALSTKRREVLVSVQVRRARAVAHVAQ